MFLSVPNPTPFDVRFRLFGTPIRIHPLFWVVGGVLGYYYWQYRERKTDQELGWQFVLVWLAVMLISVLIHELGHITAARMAGRRGQIILHLFGGLAVWQSPARHRWQRIAIAAAGPLAGFIFYGVIKIIENYGLPQFGLRFFDERRGLASMIFEIVIMLAFLNVVLNLLNLLPIWPLDGGQITLELFSGMWPAQGARVAFGVSALLAGAGAGYSALKWAGSDVPYPSFDPVLPVIFLGMMAVQNIQMLMVRPDNYGATASEEAEKDWR